MAKALIVDDVVVERLISGEPMRQRANSREKARAAWLLLEKGWSAERIAKQVGLAKRTVDRIKAKLTDTGFYAQRQQNPRR